VNLSPELEELVQREVRSGLYDNQSDVVRDAHVEGLRRALAEGLEQADRGELIDGPEAVAEVRQALRQRRKSDRTPGER